MKLPIIFQFIIGLIFTLPTHAAQTNSQAATNINTATQENNSSELIADLTQLATSASSRDPFASGTSLASGYAASAVQGWLQQYGSARVQLNVDKDGNWDNSAIDLFAPLYDNKESLLFIQPGFRAPDGRITGNIGAGVRTFYLRDWMFGSNVFLDDDFTGKNRRIGIGAEAWTNYLKLSANTYMGTTQWHQSRDFTDYEEKPADGFDIRAEGYLPSWPQLGAKVMYEQYYGDDVALFDKDNLQSNPSAITLGLNYTPIPFITTSIDYKRGQDSMDDLTFGVNFRYNIGQSWSEQISSDNVALQRSLAGSRYDLVERNNEIILQYRQKQQDQVLTDLQLTNQKDNSPADGLTANIVSVKAISNKGLPLAGTVINWTVTGSAQLSSTSSVTDANGDATINVTNKSAQQVVVQASSGNLSRSTTSTFMLSVATLELRISKNNSAADGIDQNAGVLTAKDANGQALAGVTINWQLNNSAIFTSNDSVTDAQGQATAHFTNSTPGNVLLSAATPGKTVSASSAFTAAILSKISVIMTTDNALGDGVSANTAQATLLDSSGKPVANATINWSTTGSATPVAATSVTNAEGKTSMNFSDAQAEAGLTVTASSDGQNGETTMTFEALTVAAISVQTLTDNSPADGMTADIAQATVTDTMGKVMKNITITWSATGSASPASPTSVTNENGVATMNYTDTVVEQALTLSAASGNITGSTSANFIAAPVASIAVVMITDNSLAGGTTANVAQATVTDSLGRAVTNATVNWSVSGSTTPSTSVSTTDDKGLATMSFTDATAEKGLTVTAKAEDKTGSTTASFSDVLGDITVKYPGTGGTINVNAVRSGLDISVAWPNMAVGDQVTVHFDVQGDLSPISDNHVLPDHSFATYTIVASDIGKSSVTFTVPSEEVMGLQPGSGGLEGTATATVERTSTNESNTGSVQKPVDTQA